MKIDWKDRKVYGGIVIAFLIFANIFLWEYKVAEKFIADKAAFLVALAGAESGYPKAQGLVAGLYYGGSGVKQDYAEAFKWSMKAAEQGDWRGQLLNASMYINGWGVKQDWVEACYWGLLAQMSGVAFLHGLGPENDIKHHLTPEQEAIVRKRVQERVLRQADRGNANAQWQLGGMYEQGVGVKQDYVEAFFWLSLVRRAASVPAGYDSFVSTHNAEKHLTPEQKAAVEKRVREWRPVAAPNSP